MTNLRKQAVAASKASILDAALSIGRELGMPLLSRESVARRAGCAPSLVSHYFGTVPELKQAVMREAIAREDLPLVAAGLAVGDTIAKTAPFELRQRAAATLVR